jgi:hypothetical protein
VPISSGVWLSNESARTMGGSGPPPLNENDLNVGMSVLTQITQDNVQKCTQTVQFNQSISLECDVLPAVAIAFATSAACTACGEALKTNPNVDCSNVCAACVQSDIAQSATLVLSTSCDTSNQQAATIANSIQDDIGQQLSNSQSVLSQIVGDVLGNGKGDTQNINKTDVQQFLNSMITTNNVQELLSDIADNQQITLVGTGGTKQSAITQNLLFYNTSSLIAKNLQNAGVTNAIALTASQGITNTSGSSSSSAMIIVAVVLVLIVAGAGFMVYKRFAGKAPPTAVAPPLRTLGPSKGIKRGKAVPDVPPPGA